MADEFFFFNLWCCLGNLFFSFVFSWATPSWFNIFNPLLTVHLWYTKIRFVEELRERKKSNKATLTPFEWFPSPLFSLISPSTSSLLKFFLILFRFYKINSDDLWFFVIVNFPSLFVYTSWFLAETRVLKWIFDNWKSNVTLLFCSPSSNQKKNYKRNI